MQISLGKYRPQLLAFIEAMRTEYGLPLAVPPNKVKKTAIVADILIYFIEKYDLHIYYNEPCFRTNPQKKGLLAKSNKKDVGFIFSLSNRRGIGTYPTSSRLAPSMG